MFLQ
jgi:hypothetical protein